MFVLHQGFVSGNKTCAVWPKYSKSLLLTYGQPTSGRSFYPLVIGFVGLYCSSVECPLNDFMEYKLHLYLTLNLIKLIERARGSVGRASTSGLCRADRHRFESRLPVTFISIIYLLLYTFAPLLFILLLRSGHCPMKTADCGNISTHDFLLIS